jgi:hypothetical protein
MCGKNVEFLGPFAKLRKKKATIISVMSVRLSLYPSAWNHSAPTGQISIKFDTWEFLENPSRNFKFHSILTRITETLHEDRCIFLSKEGSKVRQKHNCLVILFIAAIATTCFGRAWPSSCHNVDVYKWEKTRFYVGLVRCCGLSRRSPVWVRFQRWGLLWAADV